MTDPPKWTEEQFEQERAKAIAAFSRERLEEPLGDYLAAFDRYQADVEAMLRQTSDLAELDSAAPLVMTDARLLEVFRYLAAPPISEDDLKILAEVKSLSKGYLRGAPDQIRRLLEIVRQVLDQRRFSWVDLERGPTPAERGAAVMASAALMAASRTQTNRRMIGKNQQEAKLKEALKAVGFREVPRRRIQTVSHAPAPGEFCGESLVGTRKGDIIVRLWDQRLMPIECKVSNSSTNSVKRLNNDAAAKATSWTSDFGRRQVVPTAVLSGVYLLHNLVDAQERGLTLFWAHDLEPLTHWIASTSAG